METDDISFDDLINNLIAESTELILEDGLLAPAWPEHLRVNTDTVVPQNFTRCKSVDELRNGILTNIVHLLSKFFDEGLLVTKPIWKTPCNKRILIEVNKLLNHTL